ncbi:MAG: amino acid racemase [Cytophagaceae bacterium]|nr:amino acid racemase [Gemmatimonadaceae bacterium]
MTRSVGLIGGLGPESTIDYYRRLLKVWQRDDPTSSPSILIDSLDVTIGLRLAANDHAGLADYLLASIERLGRAGVTFVAMTANTAHVVFDDLVARTQVPLLSIVETCADEAERRGLRKLGLLGTRFTMEGTFYSTGFARRGIAVISPEHADRLAVHERYVGELLKGNFLDETRLLVTTLVRQLRDEYGLDGVILGGTELPLLLGESVIEGLPALDTTALHVDAIVARLRTGAPAAA